MLTSYNSITTNPLTAGTVEILKNVSVKTRVVDLYTFFANPDPDPAVLKMWIRIQLKGQCHEIFYHFLFHECCNSCAESDSTQANTARSRTLRRLTLRDVDN